MGESPAYFAERADGALEPVDREGETDVLAVFEHPSGARLGVHIENKLASGAFTPYQPEVCAARAERWAGVKRYVAYHQWETVLLAPSRFIARNSALAHKFITCIPDADGIEREIDVLVNGSVSGHPVSIAVECRRQTRKNDITWIDVMIGKYQHLPVDKKVAVSLESFSPAAAAKARRHNIEVLSLRTPWRLTGLHK